LQVSAAQLPENSTEPSGTLQSEPSLDRTQGSGASGRAPVFESQQLKEEIRRSLQQAIKEVDRELDSNRVQAEIDTAMVALRAQLAELRARGTGDGILDTDQFSAIHKAALESALRNLEEMDIEKMTSDIRSNLYQSLERLNDSDFGFDSNLEPDSDDIDSAGISIDGPA
jgi:predicted transcriptional regulator